MKSKKVNSASSNPPSHVWEQELLSHFLSPIDKVALDNQCKAFNYEVNGTILHIDEKESVGFSLRALDRKKRWSDFIKSTRLKKALEDPAKTRFLFSKPDEYNFSKDLKRRLRANNIDKMKDLTHFGYEMIASRLDIGKANAEEIAKVFYSHQCLDLFEDIKW